MYAVNTVPSIDDTERVKTLSFPYQKGAVGFPAMARPTSSVFANIVSLLLTGTNERVMRVEMGVNLQEFVFDNLTPIMSVRVSNMVANAIETFIPSVVVMNIALSQIMNQDGIGSIIEFNVTYTVNGQTMEQKIVYPPTTQGQ